MRTAGWRRDRRRGHRELRHVLVPGSGGLVAAYQPVVDLRDGVTVGFEGLVRGRHEGRTVPPSDLYAAARAEDRVGELDRAATTAVLREAAGRLGDLHLSVNVHPSTLGAERVESLVRSCLLLEIAPEQLIVELDETTLDQRRQDLRAALATARSHGIRVAVDHVAAGAATLELLDLLRPELVKVPLELTHALPASYPDVARLRVAAEEHGAELVVAGVETEAHERSAAELGVRLVQGYRYGRPEPTPRSGPAATSVTAEVGAP